MKDDPPLRRQLFHNPYAEEIDEQRLTFYKALGAVGEVDKEEGKLKKAINPNIFREEVRRQQRDFRQSNHEFLKMCGVMGRSSRDQSKFNYIGDSHNKNNNFAQGKTNSKNAQKKQPLVHLSLDTTQFSCSLVPEKVPMKDLYQTFPFRKDSIIFQSNQFLSADYIFFLYENQNEVAETLRIKLNNSIEDGILAEFKSAINKHFKNVGFFDYLYFVNPRPARPEKQYNYPSYINRIAQSNTSFLSRIDEDERDKFNRDQISFLEQETCERLIVCEQLDAVEEDGENLCFESIDLYSEYKAYQAINFKMQKIFEKDAVINTNIRNIISTEKIYLVEIIEEVKSYIQLSQECEGTDIMQKVYEQIISKADQYLRLLCGYTESKILTKYNIQNYQEKIYTFIEKSIRLNKEVRKLPKAVIRQFPVLEIWYDLPQNLLGYSREELHNTFYDLMEAIIIFEKKIKTSQFYDSLKIKRPGVKYLK